MRQSETQQDPSVRCITELSTAAVLASVAAVCGMVWFAIYAVL
ncbi:hypothetical protein TRM7557_01200 [Tritonibacter multivorans]|uniref:Uncharacterized protein n=1 Tax=Tritonibacter multivorans TaxID=928856 RepID=A0A0P1GP67_9RHOB|nr:hypothetical protein TRM7557_01200 [Tritonibacter multivorans]SFD64870.1 hypothetical protein SAMN04488049_11936 [Tritonibacter multivorans]